MSCVCPSAVRARTAQGLAPASAPDELPHLSHFARHSKALSSDPNTARRAVGRADKLWRRVAPGPDAPRRQSTGAQAPRPIAAPDDDGTGGAEGGCEIARPLCGRLACTLTQQMRWTLAVPSLPRVPGFAVGGPWMRCRWTLAEKGVG